jgi:hypothetical protein
VQYVRESQAVLLLRDNLTVDIPAHTRATSRTDSRWQTDPSGGSGSMVRGATPNIVVKRQPPNNHLLLGVAAAAAAWAAAPRCESIVSEPTAITSSEPKYHARCRG